MSILKPLGTNLSGIRKLQYAYADEFLSIARPLEFKLNSSDIVFRPGSDWKDFYFTPGTIKSSVKQQETDAGDLHQISHKLSFPKDNAESTLAFSMMSKRPLLVKTEDNNGTQLLYGELNAPLKAQYDITKDGQPGGANQYDIEITGKTLFPPSYIVT